MCYIYSAIHNIATPFHFTRPHTFPFISWKTIIIIITHPFVNWMQSNTTCLPVNKFNLMGSISFAKISCLFRCIARTFSNNNKQIPASVPECYKLLYTWHEFIPKNLSFTRRFWIYFWFPFLSHFRISKSKWTAYQDIWCVPTRPPYGINVVIISLFHPHKKCLTSISLVFYWLSNPI